MASKWEELERWMEGQHLPKGFEVIREPDWVEKFVRNLMTKALPEASDRISDARAPGIAETKSFITVQYRLPAGSGRGDIQLYVREDRLRVVDRASGNRELIPLPMLVKPRICQAAVKNGILYVKLRKRPSMSKYVEHSIRW
ncbi:Hsp20/alpha crystallin family protein [Paenibacillus sp. LHD-117]|uniref:Hsp20/alpha crystallin family protein n=1 Tax=Paenibacillus sp. LHD-117 TaxID=3071412 RepID=UPI0027E1FCB2|nr:Hsp20/alpha crystallin family protein [Paenibacillus sp. LHD-117]MDQ6421080.1 Hsp20/alpha crystallin family protein [Paenibacillus sp. LHD-117]